MGIRWMNFSRLSKKREALTFADTNKENCSDEQSGNKRRESQSDLLIALVENAQVELFHTPLAKLLLDYM